MLKIMNDLPANVLGVSAEGKITGADYETILIPAVEEKLKANKKWSSSLIFLLLAHNLDYQRSFSWINICFYKEK